MIRFRRKLAPAVVAAAVCFAAAAWAERIFPVNDAGTGVFDQPSVAANGTVLHLAFVGDNAATGNFRLYYAAVNGAADFTSAATTAPQVLLTSPAAIDNTLFSDARHPQIALRTAKELVVLFSATPVGDTDPKLFRARVTVDNNAVQTVDVKEVLDPLSGRMAGRLSDPSFAVVAADNSLRAAYSDKTTGDVFYTRIGIDNAFLVGSPIRLTRPGTQGSAALPRLGLEGTTRSHIAWSSETAGSTSLIYYSMVKEVAKGVDNLAIGATAVLQGPYNWRFPNVLIPSTARVLVLAGDDAGVPGKPGLLGTAYLDPDAVTHDGNFVNPGNTIANRSFFVFPPDSNTPLSPTFSVFHPEATIDGTKRIHVAGYGSSSGAFVNAGVYFTMSLLGVTATTGESAALISPGVPIGIDNSAFADSIPGDYTRPAFAHFSGKAVHFWSGPDNTVPSARNLFVTSTVSSSDPPVPVKQSGCSMVGEPRRGESERIPGAAVLLLPAVLLALRKGIRKGFAR
ncbi:MAG: hypothetical protein OHK0028_18290 [Deltaproteobacteria bacterium]